MMYCTGCFRLDFRLVLKPQQHEHIQYVCLFVSVCVEARGVASPSATILVLHSAGCHGDNTALAVENVCDCAPDKVNNLQVSVRELGGRKFSASRLI